MIQSKDVSPGTKVAKAVSARFIKSPKKNTPGIEVAFQFEETNSFTGEIGQARMNWVGWLSEGARERTMETLVERLGCNGVETTDDDGKFNDPNFLDWERQVELVVELEQQEGQDKAYPRIQWVNTLGGSGFGSVEPTVVKQALKDVGFKGLFLSAKKNLPSAPAANPLAPGGVAVPGKKAPF